MSLLIYTLNELKSIGDNAKSLAELQKSLTILLDQTREKERKEKLENEAHLLLLISDIKGLISESENLLFQELTEQINKLLGQYKSDLTVNLGYLNAKEINDLLEDLTPSIAHIRSRAKVYKLAPEFCLECNGEVKYWDETEEEIIFQCVKCTRQYTIPYDPHNKTIYFS